MQPARVDSPYYPVHLFYEELAICPAGEKRGGTDKADSSLRPFYTRAESGEHQDVRGLPSPGQHCWCRLQSQQIEDDRACEDWRREVCFRVHEMTVSCVLAGNAAVLLQGTASKRPHNR